MITSNDKVKDPSQKKVTLPFIGRHLRDSGFEATREGTVYYVDIAQESDMIIGFENNRLSVEVAMPINEEEFDAVAILSNITMAATTLTKIFLIPEEDETNLWFSVETICKTRGQFEEAIDIMLKQLLESVRKFIEIREELEKAAQLDMMATCLANQNSGKQPS